MLLQKWVTHFIFSNSIGYNHFLYRIKSRSRSCIARSAGAFAQLWHVTEILQRLNYLRRNAFILLPVWLALELVSNSDHQLLVSGKAGRSRWLGRRPRTRPVAMNPVDHPMGGGEGRASGGHPRSRNGIPAKGFQNPF